MRMTKQLPMKIKLFTMALAASVLVACEETELGEGAYDGEIALSEQFVENEAAFLNTYTIVDLAMRNDDLLANDSVTIDGAAVTMVGANLVIDYGQGVLGADGQMRKGTLNVLVNGDYKTIGMLTVDMSNYTLKEMKASGSMEITNYNLDSITLSSTEFSVNTMKLVANKTLTWKSGFGTPSADDDLFQLMGSAWGTDSSGVNSIAIATSERLEYDAKCAHKMVSGIFDLSFDIDSVADNNSGSLDFINSDGCNNLIKVTVDKGESSFSTTQQFSGF